MQHTHKQKYINDVTWYQNQQTMPDDGKITSIEISITSSILMNTYIDSVFRQKE